MFAMLDAHENLGIIEHKGFSGTRGSDNDQLLSPFIQGDYVAPVSKGSVSPHFDIEALKLFPFRLSSLIEQTRIVGRLDAIRADVERIQNLQTKTTAELATILTGCTFQSLPATLD